MREEDLKSQTIQKLFAAKAADLFPDLREAIERADYYINRLEAAYRGQCVRDLDEAANAWNAIKKRVWKVCEPHL